MTPPRVGGQEVHSGGDLWGPISLLTGGWVFVLPRFVREDVHLFGASGGGGGHIFLGWAGDESERVTFFWDFSGLKALPPDPKIDDPPKRWNMTAFSLSPAQQ